MASEEEPLNMVEQEDNSVKMAGYLDKRGKLKLVTTWKRYWFVLKDQLLLYYKSQLECLNLSACRGSLNMGLASCVRPGAHRGPPANNNQGYTIEVVTRSQVITLRTKDRAAQEQWLKALLESMALPNISSPLRLSGGPLHFRYSLDNLPVVEELETEDPHKEKQKTLPHRTSVARHDSVLGRIKKIGGQSYGGSLDTILKRRPNNQSPHQQSPQQPKIPRIKAVDRMLGLQDNKEEEEEEEEEEECEEDNIHIEENSGSEKNITGSSNVKPKVKGSNKPKILSFKGKLSKNSDKGKKNCESNVFSKKQKVKNVESVEIKEECKISENSDIENYNNFGAGDSESKSDENQNSRTCVKIDEDTTVSLPNSLVCEGNKNSILIENKLYEKTNDLQSKDVGSDCQNVCKSDELIEERNKTKENTCDSKTNEEANIVNKEAVHSKSKEKLNDNQHISCSQSDEKGYEDLTGNAVKQDSNKLDINEEDEEDEYYCKYDKFSLLQSLSDQRNSSSPEPDLPPRPINSSNDLNKSQTQPGKTDDEDDYNAYYETSGSYTGDMLSSPSQLVSLGTNSSSEKKGLKLGSKIKLRKAKSPSKESVKSEDVSTANSNKKKRKMSFLKRVLKHYRKKPEPSLEQQATSDNLGSSDEPEYETVDYAIVMQTQKDEESKAKEVSLTNESDCSGSPDKEVHKEKLFGQSLLPDQAFLELKMKLKVRDDANDVPVSSEIDDNEGYELISPEDTAEKKPVPTPRMSKQKSNYNVNKGSSTEHPRNRCNESINRSNKPPSLPPRKVARPRSPWHDVPTNNSPVYGNFQDLGINIEKTSEEQVKENNDRKSSNEDQTEQKTSEWDQELQDELLGTPRGFIYIQNKWKAVEKSGVASSKNKLFKKLSHKERSPDKSSSDEEGKNRRVRNESLTNTGHEYDKKDQFSNSSGLDIYSDVNRKPSSAKTLIKSFNKHSEKNIDEYDKNRIVIEERNNNKDSGIEGTVNSAAETLIKSAEVMGSSDLCMMNTQNPFTDCAFNGSTNSFNQNNFEHYIHIDNAEVILRKQHGEMCNKHLLYLGETETHKADYTKENFPSSQLKDANYSLGLEENNLYMRSDPNVKNCFNIRQISSSQQIKNVVYNHNVNNINFSMSGVGDQECYGDIMPRLNRHSDELNILLAQLAEITSAPLLPQGAATSLVDLPENRKPKIQTDEPFQHGPAQHESFMLGPIRRRRHSDPDYDVPRPHGSLLHLLTPNRLPVRNSGQSQSAQDTDVIEATRFFGEADLISNSTRSSLSLRHSVISEVDDQSETSYYVSMAPDSLEVPPLRDMEGN